MDSLFHYYGSYLAGRLAGLEQQQAQRLAYYCYGMTELKADSQSMAQWSYCELSGESRMVFSPCVVLSDDNSRYGKFNSKLAFTQLPCMNNNNNTVKDGRLLCEPNSLFAQKMMNDAIDKKNKTAGIDPLALFACRLFVYQQTWIGTLKNDNNEKVRHYMVMFYWTTYAIQCFMAGKPMNDKLRIRLFSDGAKVELLKSMLHGIFMFEGSLLEKEYCYLSRLACVLSYGEMQHKTLLDSWYQGFRLRPNFLVEKALLASGGSRQIQFLSAFQQSEFYHLNRAVEVHCIWLTEQLALAGLGELSTTQHFES